MIQRILTIGAHGFDAEQFAEKLWGAKVDMFVDIRARRGMRGSEYAFANAARLQALLANSGIPYEHAKELAPSDAVRELQKAADTKTHTKSRERLQLSEGFVARFTRDILKSFDSKRFIDQYCQAASRPVLFCVEREPLACHRSLVAERLSKDLRVPVTHLVP